MPLSALAAIAALVPAASLSAQAASVMDPQTAPPLPGTWTYSVTAGETQSAFVDSSSRTQLVVKCARSTRQVSISKPSSAPIAQLVIWTSELSRNVPVSFDQSRGQARAAFTAYDPLLDALALSRARIAIGVPGAPLLVLPAAPEIARVVEDCRA